MGMKTEQLKSMKTRPASPGEVLRDILDDIGMSQVKLAERLGVSRQTVNHLLNGKRALTAEMGHRLGRLLGNGPELWLNLQKNVDLWDALHMDTRSFESIQPLHKRAA